MPARAVTTTPDTAKAAVPMIWMKSVVVMVSGSLAGSVRWLNKFSDGLRGCLKNAGLVFGIRHGWLRRLLLRAA